MSYADQGTLADRLEVEGLTPAQALEVVRQVGLGLKALHERGVLHRDVKPANVLFRTVEAQRRPSRTVRAMLADLGLGKALDMSSRLTMIAGTPSFVAPEQAQGERLDARADQYSLAALTYLLLSGRAAFRHASLSAAAQPGPPPGCRGPAGSSPTRSRPSSDGRSQPDREDRWPDVATYVEALRRRARPEPRRRRGSLPEPWLPLDPNLTQPGPRPTALPADGDAARPDAARGRSRRRRSRCSPSPRCVRARGRRRRRLRLQHAAGDGVVEVSDDTTGR